MTRKAAIIVICVILKFYVTAYLLFIYLKNKLYPSPPSVKWKNFCYAVLRTQAANFYLKSLANNFNEKNNENETQNTTLYLKNQRPCTAQWTKPYYLSLSALDRGACIQWLSLSGPDWWLFGGRISDSLLVSFSHAVVKVAFTSANGTLKRLRPSQK